MDEAEVVVAVIVDVDEIVEDMEIVLVFEVVEEIVLVFEVVEEIVLVLEVLDADTGGGVDPAGTP